MTTPRRSSTSSGAAATPRIPTSAPGPAPRPVGRPRSSTADQAILDAALGLLGEVGVNGLTMSAVVERSGVARATVYRRYPTREALAAAVLARVKGRDPFPLSGNIATDLARAAHQAAVILAEPQFRRHLPLFVAEAASSPAAARAQIERVAPNHGRVSREYDHLAGTAGLRTDVDGSIVGDIVIGTMLMRFLSTGRAPDKAAERQLVAILERGLQAEAAGSETAEDEGAA